MTPTVAVEPVLPLDDLDDAVLGEREDPGEAPLMMTFLYLTANLEK